MAEKIDEAIVKEIEAIKTLVLTLEPLGPEARANVLEFVLKRLQIDLETPPRSSEDEPEVLSAIVEPPLSPMPVKGSVHIKELKEEKKPRSANEMAALVAYYLANLAPENKRKNSINTEDIDTYFKIAQFRLPDRIDATLGNAKAAGYFDTAGPGEYKLNAIGHNLVAHSMPRGAGTMITRKKKAKKPQSTKKPAARSKKKK